MDNVEVKKIGERVITEEEKKYIEKMMENPDWRQGYIQGLLATKEGYEYLGQELQKMVGTTIKMGKQNQSDKESD